MKAADATPLFFLSAITGKGARGTPLAKWRRCNGPSDRRLLSYLATHHLVDCMNVAASSLLDEPEHVSVALCGFPVERQVVPR